MSLNDILDDGDAEKRKRQETADARGRAAAQQLNDLLHEACKSLTEALEETPGLGEVKASGGNRIERRPERISQYVVAQSAGERLQILVEGQIAWVPGDRLGWVGHGEATPLSVKVWRTDRSMMIEEKFTFPIASAPVRTGHYPVQREAFQARLTAAVRKLAAR